MLAQQLLNGIVVSGVYALFALGFTLVFGIRVVDLSATAQAIDCGFQGFAVEPCFFHQFGDRTVHFQCSQKYQFTGNELVATLLRFPVS